MTGIMMAMVNNNAVTVVPTNGSVLFNGTSQYLEIAQTAAFGFGTADFTIEFWWRPTVNQRSDVLDFWSTPGTNPTTRFDIGRITGTTLDLYTDSSPGGSGAKITGPSLASLLNTWSHIAITRQSGSIYMWVNGTQAGSTYSANVLDMGTSGMALRIMGDHGAGANGSGNFTNIRVVTGTALYTSTFTPPAQPLTAVSGTQLLLNNYLGAGFLTDGSTNNLSVTNTGGATSSALNPFPFVVPATILFTAIGTTTWTAPAYVTTVEYLVVAGGGGAGNGYDNAGGGGGGAGMVLTGNVSVTPGQSYTVTVGGGGAGGADTRTNNPGSPGSNSVFSSITALGGGQGLGSRTGGAVGAAQIGSSTAPTGGAGTGGGTGGLGGGGASTAGGSNSGATGGTGGAGTASSITGSSVTYGVGGAGGGAGAPTTDGANGTANRGNGGQGGKSNSADSAKGGDGGSGIVVVRYGS